MVMTLTPQQAKLKGFIIEYMGSGPVAPSYTEMAAYMGLASNSGINRLIVALEERGHIRRLPNRARALEIITDSPARFINPDLPPKDIPLLTISRLYKLIRRERENG